MQRFFERAWGSCGGTITRDDQFPVWQLGRTPTSLLETARATRRSVRDEYRTPFVFNKQLLSVASTIPIPDYTRLLGPGHPLFEVLIEWAIRNSRDAFAKGTTLIAPDVSSSDHVWLVRSTVLDARMDSRRRVANEKLAVIREHGGMGETSPACFLLCVPPEFADLAQEGSVRSTTGDVSAWAYEHISLQQLDKVSEERSEDCELRRRYLNTAFQDLILERTAKLNDLQQASLFGDQNARERNQLHDNIETLKRRRKDRLGELDLMLDLTVDLPSIITEAILIPDAASVGKSDEEEPATGVPMRRDDEVEAIAMGIAMEYERSRGWTPHDVHLDGEHYDVRSESPNRDKRFIEVKGRAQSGPVMVTGPEKDKLEQLGDRAWLYVVTNCRAGAPNLRTIQDPFSKLNPRMLYRDVQYLVDESDWMSYGVEPQVDGKNE